MSKEYGNRVDGTRKSSGFLGELKLKGGGIATEYSIGIEIDGKEIELPTLVPTLTGRELRQMTDDIIPNRRPIPEPIMRKAVDHAMRRIKQGKSPFKEDPAAEKAKKRRPLLTFK